MVSGTTRAHRLCEPVRAAFTPRGRRAEGRARDGRVQYPAFEGETVELYQASRGRSRAGIASKLGADPEDRGRFQDWSDDLAAIVFSLTPGTLVEPAVRATQFVASSPG
jgi:hypothetical protein